MLIDGITDSINRWEEKIRKKEGEGESRVGNRYPQVQSLTQEHTHWRDQDQPAITESDWLPSKGQLVLFRAGNVHGHAPVRIHVHLRAFMQPYK